MDQKNKDNETNRLRVPSASEEGTGFTGRRSPPSAASPTSTGSSAQKQSPAKWFDNIHLAPRGHEDIREITRKAAVVHVFEQRSRTDLACLKYKYKSENIPYPENVIGGIGAIFFPRSRSEIEQAIPQPGKPKAMFLGTGTSVERLAELIKFARKADYPVILAPQVVLYERRPAKSGSPGWWDSLVGPGGRPKLVRKWWTLLKSRGSAIISAADPIDIKQFTNRPDVAGLPDLATARILLDTLRMTLREERRVVIGPHLPPRERMKNIIRRHPLLIKSIKEEAARTNRADWEVWQEVDRNLEEIMADYNVTYIRIWEKLLSWVWRRFFGGVLIDNIGLERTRRAVRKGPVIYVPCHKSHTDYLLVSYVLFTNDMTPPHIAAGKNLNFWPLGHIFRRSGAFFMRRSFAGAGIYKTVFECYIRSLIREGFNIEFFIEGGRSRTGKLFLPKMGILSMLVRAFEEGELPDLSFVPIAISYDRVPEEGELLGETQGTKTSDGLIKSFVEIMKKNFGRIHVNFAAPISLKEYLALRHAEPSVMDTEARRALYRDFAFRVIHSINEVSVISPTAVMAAALLARQAPAVDEAVAMADAATLLNYLEATDARLAPSFRNPAVALAEALRLFTAMRDIKGVPLPGGEEGDGLLAIDPEKRLGIEYYKNNALHALYPAAFVASSILATNNDRISLSEIERDYALLTKYFKYEFVYQAHWPVESECSRVIELFKKWGMIETAPDTAGRPEPYWVVTENGRDVLSLFYGLLENLFEAYLYIFENLPKIFGKKEFLRDEGVKDLMHASIKAFHLGRLKRRESISAVTFQNAISLTAHLGIIKEIEPQEGSKSKWRMTSGGDRLIEDCAANFRRFLKSH